MSPRPRRLQAPLLSFAPWTQWILANIASIWLAASAHAATFAVNTVTDGVDIAPGDGVCASANGKCTLRAAVQEANSHAGADVITLGVGHYALAENELEISDDLTISGAGVDRTSIRGSRRTRVATVANAVTVNLAGLRIERGSAAAGGGVLNNGTLQLLNVTFAGNRATNDAGSGGAIYNNGTLVASNVAFTGNRAMAAAGGFGGALFNNGSAQLSGVTFTGNRTNGCGGAVFNATGTVDLVNVTMRSNRASNSGGGLFAQQGRTTLTNVTLNGNRARKIGGGVFSYSPLALTNVTLASNRAVHGGGVFCSYNTATLRNVTISSNHAVHGGGILNSNATLTLTNSIIARNAPQNCDGTPMLSGGHNLESATSCSFSAIGDLSGVNPLLGPLRDNGGLTPTMALLAGSPAIDAGTDVDAPSSDQRGAARPADGNGDHIPAYDIGAYEVQP